MTFEFCYICDKDGSLYVKRVKPEYLKKTQSTWMCERPGDAEGNWCEVSRVTLHTLAKSGIEALLDLTEVPVPKWEDEKPTIVVLNTSTSYYTIDQI